jgi:WD40 repeat protein
VTSVAISNDSICCYVGCSNGRIYVYNFRSRVLLRILTHHESTVNDLYISADDCFLFSAGEVRPIEMSLSVSLSNESISRVQFTFSISNRKRMVSLLMICQMTSRPCPFLVRVTWPSLVLPTALFDYLILSMVNLPSKLFNITPLSLKWHCPIPIYFPCRAQWIRPFASMTMKWAKPSRNSL